MGIIWVTFQTCRCSHLGDVISPKMPPAESFCWTHRAKNLSQGGHPCACMFSTEESVLPLDVLPLMKEGKTRAQQEYFARLLFCLKNSGQTFSVALVNICNKHLRQRSLT